MRLAILVALRLLRLRRLLDHLVAGDGLIGVFEVVVTQTLDLVIRRLKVRVRNHHHIDLEARFHAPDLIALLVEQEGADIHRNLHVHSRRVLLHRLFLQDAQDVQRGRFGVAHKPSAVAARTRNMAALRQGWTQPLTRQLEHAEARDLAHLHAGAVQMQRVLEAVLDVALVLRRLHVDEVDHHQTAKVAQSQLASDFVGSFEVGAEGGLLDVRTAGRTRRVDVHRDQRFGVVDDNGATRRQVDLPRVRGLDLVLDLEAREQRHVVLVELDAIDVGRHHVAHELLGLLVNSRCVDEDLADVGGEVIADGANDQARFLVNQERTRRAVGGALDGAPQLQQVVEVPLQLFERPADACGARDHTHAGRDLELGDQVAQLVAVLALDAAADATAARVVGHQHQIATCQTDVGGERRTLVAALVLVDLNDQLKAFLDPVRGPALNRLGVAGKTTLGDLFKRQKTVAIGAVIDEHRFETRLDAGDPCLVDVGFALLAASGFDVEVDQLLTIDDGDAQLFGLRRIEQHALHFTLPRARAGRISRQPVVGRDATKPAAAWAARVETLSSGDFRMVSTDTQCQGGAFSR